MAIAIRGTTPATHHLVGSSGSPLTVTLSGSRQPQSGDLLVIWHGNDFYALSNMPTPTVGGSTSGVTSIANADMGSNQSHTKGWYYVVGSTGDLTVAVTETGTGDEERMLVAYTLSGVNTSSPIDGTAVTGGSTSTGSSRVLSAITTSNTDSMLFAHVSPGPSAGGTGYTPPGSPWVEDYDADSAGGSAFWYTGGHEQLSASGSTGTRTFTLLSSVAEWSGVMVAIKAGAPSGDATASPAVIARSFTVPAVISAGQPPTFPTVPTAGANTLLQTNQSTATTTHTFPSLTTLDNAAGDLLLAIIVTYQGSTTNAEFSSWGGGFTEFVDQASNSTTVQPIGAAYKFSDGTETGTFTVTSATSNRSVMFLLSIKNAHTSTLPEATARATGTTASADPASLNPTNWDAEDTLWIAVGVNGETSLSGTFTGITAAPTNYTNYVDSGIIGGDIVGALEGAVGFRQVNASAEDAGGFTQDVGAANNSALVIAVRPAGAASATPTPAVIARSFVTPQVGVGVGAAPAVIARSFTTPAAVQMVGAGPAVIARSFTVPQPVESVGAAPAVIPLVTTLPSATVGGTTTVNPAVIARSFTTPQALVSVAAAPAVIARSFTLPDAPVSVGAAPAVLATVVVIPEWSVNPTVVPDTAPAIVALPQATGNGGAGPATATPAVITRAFTVPPAGAGVGAAPVVIARSFVLPQAVESVGAAPAVIARSFTVPQPAESVGAAPLVIARAFTLPLAGTAGATIVTPLVIDRAFALPQLAASVGAAPAVIARAFALPQATNPGAGATTVTPAVIDRLFTLPQLAVSVGELSTVIARAFTIPQATPVDSGIPATPTPAVIARSFVMPQLVVSVGVIPTVIARVFVLPQALVVIPPLYSFGYGSVGEIILVASGVPVVVGATAGESGSSRTATGVTGILGG